MSGRRGQPAGPMISRRTLTRGLTLGALAAVAVALAAITSGGSSGYVMYAKFGDAGGLRQGCKVRIDGAPVGQVESLSLNAQDQVVAKLGIDSSAAPVGTDAHATVRAADLLGEKYIDLQPGNRQAAARSGSTIPVARTALAVELDDVLNSIDASTQTAVRLFINEQGRAFVGRGGDLAATLSVLPSSLDQTGQLLGQFSQDNQALGRLVEESNRVIASVARERRPLGQLVGSAAGTLSTLAGHEQQLGATVARAPAALVSARRALAALEGAAMPLGPAAQGLSATAPQLTATLNALPALTAAARPTLATIRNVSPTLTQLGRGATPVVQNLRSLTNELGPFSAALDPVSQTLDKGTPDILGVLEGWARATQGRDGSSHVFRFGLTVSPDTFSSLAPLFAATKAPAGRSATSALKAATTVSRVVGAPPSTPAAAAPQGAPAPQGSKQPQTVAQGLLRQLGLGGAATGPSLQSSLQGLLGYLLK